MVLDSERWWGDRGCLGGGGVLSLARLLPAWEEPSPEILIQGRDRTGFPTASAKGDRVRESHRVRRTVSGPKGRWEDLARDTISF